MSPSLKQMQVTKSNAYEIVFYFRKISTFRAHENKWFGIRFVSCLQFFCKSVNGTHLFSSFNLEYLITLKLLIKRFAITNIGVKAMKVKQFHKLTFYWLEKREKFEMFEQNVPI